MTKTEKIRRAMLKSPKATAQELAERCKVTVQDVYSARYLMKKQNKANGYTPKPNMHAEMLKEVMPGLNSLFGTDYAAAPSEVTIKEDMVNHPPHYTVGGIETIDFIEAKDLNYRLGNVVKYIVRAGHKDSDPLQDLQKARWYLDREIARVE